MSFHQSQTPKKTGYRPLHQRPGIAGRSRAHGEASPVPGAAHGARGLGSVPGKPCIVPPPRASHPGLTPSASPNQPPAPICAHSGLGCNRGSPSAGQSEEEGWEPQAPLGSQGGLRCPEAAVGLGASATGTEPRTAARSGRAARPCIVHHAREREREREREEPKPHFPKSWQFKDQQKASDCQGPTGSAP